MAFHPYPRVIPSVFNRSGFGPPQGLTPASACPRIAHPASRPRHATRAILKARFRCGSFPNLTSPHAATRWLILQKARRHARQGRSDCLWAQGFRYCFTPLSGCFSPFPHGTGTLSVAGECSALEGGPPGFRPGFTCPDVLGNRLMRGARIRVRGSHPVPPAFPCRSASSPLCNRIGSRQPPGGRPRNTRAATPDGFDAHTGLGSRAFARRYSRDLG